MDKDFFDQNKWKSNYENKIETEDQTYRKKLILISAISVLIIIAIIVVLSIIKINVNEETENIVVSDTTNVTSSRPVEIFFMGEDGISMYSENREIPITDDLCTDLRYVIEELIQGPQSSDLASPLPYTTKLFGIFVDNEGRLYVNFSKEFVEDNCKGTACEIAVIKTLIKTTAYNFPQISQLQILVEGKPIKSIGGHLNIEEPFYVIDWL